jgi:hypothetical protein
VTVRQIARCMGLVFLFSAGALVSVGALVSASAVVGLPEFADLDADGNGYISQAELKQAGDAVPVPHRVLDQNEDGRLDASEFAALERDLARRRDASGASNGAGRGGDAGVGRDAPLNRRP